MSKYTPRKCSKRWLDGDCPEGVLAIMDDKASGDRYTVFYSEPVCGTTYADMVLGYRGMSACPTHPQGIGMWGEMSAHEVTTYRCAKKHHYAKWSSLPKEVQDCVRRDLEPTT